MFLAFLVMLHRNSNGLDTLACLAKKLEDCLVSFILCCIDSTKAACNIMDTFFSPEEKGKFFFFEFSDHLSNFGPNSHNSVQSRP